MASNFKQGTIQNNYRKAFLEWVNEVRQNNRYNQGDLLTWQEIKNEVLTKLIDPKSMDSINNNLNPQDFCVRYDGKNKNKNVDSYFAFLSGHCIDDKNYICIQDDINFLRNIDLSKYKKTNSKNQVNQLQGGSNMNNTNNQPTISNFKSSNTIFYGVPGCGKSYHVNDLLKTGNVDASHYKRVLFYPDYTYSDFIGQTKPVVNGGNITYSFVPGPFTTILKEAYNSDEDFYLIIEEINRGNAPAIFGDVFQLLDRDTTGKSEYPINNQDMAEIIYQDTSKQIIIPANLTIFATMNTSDQNVFTLDTAFKRRWRMSRIKNNLSNAHALDIRFSKNFTIKWKDFVEALNKDIINSFKGNSFAEDKLIGAFFVKDNEINNIEAFADKILIYLWNDVFKIGKDRFFNLNYTFDELRDKFINGDNVFSANCSNLEKLYSQQNQTTQTQQQTNP